MWKTLLNEEVLEDLGLRHVRLNTCQGVLTTAGSDRKKVHHPPHLACFVETRGLKWGVHGPLGYKGLVQE